MALFKISKGLSKNLMTNVPYAKEGFAYFTSDDGKFYIDINGDGTNASPAVIGDNRIPLSALSTDWIKATKIEDTETYPILAFKVADNTKNLIELKYGSVGYKDGTLVIPNVETGSKDEVLIENNDEGSALTIDNKGAGTGIKIINTGEDSLVNNQGININNNILLNMNGSASFNGSVTIGGTNISKGDAANILGTNKTNTIISNQLTLQQGAVFGGNAQNAGLITRGICGVSTPTDDGTCEKDNLYINYDGDNSYKASRHVILQAGEAGKDYGNHLYQYAAARGDAVHDWSLNNFYIKSDIDNKLNNLLATNDAMVFKGTIGGDAAATIHELPAKHSAGETYRVYDIKGGNNGKYLGNGEVCEIGDLIICIKDGTTHSAGDWTIVQTNIDGAVIGPNTSTANAVSTFADATGKIIKNNSTVTIDNTGLFTAPYIATGTDKTHYFQSRKFRGEGNADTYYHAIDFGYSGHNQVDFHEYGGIWNFYENTKGTAADGKLVASIKPDGFHGNLNGNATSANKVNNNLVIKLNSGTTEGTNQFTYDGSATKNINITPANIGAASSSHNHDSSYVKKSGDTMTGDLTLNKKLIANNLIVLKNGQTYGTSTPANGTAGQLFFAQDTSDSDYLPLTGGTLSGNLTLNEKLLITNKMYGTTKPSNPVEGQIFFQENDGSLTLPAGGTAGQYLVKNSSNDSDASWKSLPALNYLPLSGGTLTGNLTISHSDTNDATVRVTNSKGSIGLLSSTNRGLYDYTKSKWLIYTDGTKASTSYALYGAVWNDYAEFREGDTIDAGRCVVEVGDDTLITSTERLMPGANITSDTFGFAIGETEQAKTPIAVSGRVLAYPYESREEFKKNVGRPVCSGPNGTVSIMTDEEYRNKGYCAIGTISAVPDYEEWGTGKVKVNGRVWIKV